MENGRFPSRNRGGGRPFLLEIRPFSFTQLWWGTAVFVGETAVFLRAVMMGTAILGGERPFSFVQLWWGTAVSVRGLQQFCV
ncbi:MAG: hypothetical protein KJ063_01250 [Anaerolineae bacterium]|nr:hypothetical protein [Anaerolineae bacterium]